MESPAESVQMHGCTAQCPFCQRYVRIQPDKYGTATVYAMCVHFVESYTQGDKRYATFARDRK